MASGLFVASAHICQICIGRYTEATDVGFPFDEIGCFYCNSASLDFSKTVEPFPFQSQNYVAVRDELKLDARLVSPCHMFFTLYLRGT